jgi:cytochrome oxidase Cu insertion factor (SCO1/SenC/PrrC family)
MGKSRNRKLAHRAAPSQPTRKPLDWKLIVVPIVVVGLLVTAGLIVRNTLTSSASAVTVHTSANPPAPSFSVATVNGPHFSLAAQRGHPVVLYFMAAWCTSCLPESQALGQLQQKYGDGVRIVLVDIDPKQDSPSALRSFVDRSSGPSRYWVLDSGGTITTAFGVQTLDTTYVIDKQGGIAYSNNHPIDYATLDHIVGQVA